MNPGVSVQVQPTSDWNPSPYMKFADERMFAARDLLARVPLASARLVYDLGCGPGNSAELLSRRFPDADIIGLDTSEAMLDRARTRAPRARFVRQNIVDWVPTEPPNLIFANAALDFLSDHHALFPRLAAMLAPGGVFAAQMPSTARESSHALMRMVAAEGPWSSRLVPVAKTQPVIAQFEDYYAWLRPVASRIDMWMTTYVLMFDGPEEIADWFAGSALQPFLELLSDDERCAFLARYRDGLFVAHEGLSPASPRPSLRPISVALKLIGDGVLAIFPAEERSRACAAALDAARQAQEAVRVLNNRRLQEGVPTTEMYLGLHVGEVLYGNIGSKDRLDFTVVGPAVNEVSRIAAMCRSVDQPVLLSAAFVASVAEERRRFVSLGRYALRGVSRPREAPRRERARRNAPRKNRRGRRPKNHATERNLIERA